MKKFFIALLLYYIATCTMLAKTKQVDENCIEKELYSSEHNFTDYLFRRFYFVHRLSKTMSLFLTLSTKKLSKVITMDNYLLFTVDTLPFQHETIKASIKAMQQTKSFKPLCALWNDFKQYKSLHDQLLVEEFVKEILVVSRNLIISSPNIPPEKKKECFFDFFKNVTLSSYALLDIIDLYVSLFLHYNPSIYKTLHVSREAPFIQKKGNHIHLKHVVHVNEVMERFYHIKRLNKSKIIMQKIYPTLPDLFLEYSIQEQQIEFQKCCFSHPFIVECIKTINVTKKLDAFFMLWDDIERYKYINDTSFIREFLLLLYAMHTEIYMHQVIIKKKTTPALLHMLESLPLEKILQAIDIMTDNLQTIIEKYELQANITWKEWFKKYWWAPPLIAITIACKLLLALKITHIFSDQPA